MDFRGRLDYWGRYEAKTMYAERIVGGKEQYFGDVLVYAPCNYASSVAFYHSVTRLCDYP